MTYQNIFKSIKSKKDNFKKVFSVELKLNAFLILAMLMIFAFGFISEVNAQECPAVDGCPEFNCDPADLELLVLKNRTQETGWQHSISANCGDRVAFQIYYHNCAPNTTANNTRIRIDYPDSSSTSIISTAYLWADNASYVSDTGKINISTAQKLVFDSTAKWYPNQSANATIIPVTKYYRSAEVNIGGIKGNWTYQGYVTFEAVITDCKTHPAPTVDIEANNSDGPITIAHNTSADLTWTSANADSCYASNGWSGTKAVSGSQSTGNLTSSRTYTITCTGSGGSDSDSVKVNVDEEDLPDLSINKTVRNLSRGTDFSKTIYADPGDVLVFGVVIKAEDDPLYDVTVKDTLPAGLIYQGELKVNDTSTGGNVLTGLDIGNLSVGQKKTITFKVQVAGAENFPFGQTEINNTALASNDQVSFSDSAKVIVSKTAVAGVATVVPTGLTNNIFVDSFLLPLVVTLMIVWLLKSHIVKFEEWLDLRKEEYQTYKSKKILQMRIARIKIQEFFQRAR